jgi:hypothetical protein
MITHIKGSKVTPYTQRMYKVGYGPNTFGYTSEDKLSTITPPIPNAVEYSHERTIYYLNEDSLEEPTSQDNIIKMHTEGR